MSASKAWKVTVGRKPHRVTALEDPKRGSVVYLRWWENGNWKHQSLGESCRTASGKLIHAVCQRAEAAARTRSLQRQMPRSPSSRAPVTVTSVSSLCFHPDIGRWRSTTPHGKEIARALAIAATTWGTTRAWDSLTRGDWRQLWRARLSASRAAGHNGFPVTKYASL